MKRWVELLSETMSRKLVFLDVGARGGVKKPWDKFGELIYPILVEPDAEEATKLINELDGSGGRVIQYALWKERASLNLFLTQSRGCSSCFQPNEKFLKYFPNPERFLIEKTIQIEGISLDQLTQEEEMPSVDFAKIDVQGAELSVLKGGSKSFADDLVGLEVEVEFSPMYVGQPLFSDVEKYIRETLALELWDISKTYWKCSSGMQFGAIKGKLIMGDALFFRGIESLDDWYDRLGSQVSEQKIIMLIFTALVYGYGDYAWQVLIHARSRRKLCNVAVYKLEQAVQALGNGLRPLKNGHGRLFAVLNAIAKIFKPSHRGWASVDDGLGSGRRGPFWT